MKFLLIALASMMALAATACGGANIEVYLGALVSGVTTASNPNDIGGISDSYLVRVKEGVEYYVYLSSPDATSPVSGTPTRMTLSSKPNLVRNHARLPIGSPKAASKRCFSEAWIPICHPLSPSRSGSLRHS